MKKNILVIVLALIPMLANAYDANIDGIYYNLNSGDKTATVTYTYNDGNFNSYSGSIKIPETVSYKSVTYSVTSIGYAAFNRCSSLESVTIPNSVTSIGDYAFSGCSLKKVVLNSNEIASKSYSRDFTINTIFGSQVEEYVIGESVRSIGDYAFSGCDKLKSIIIGNNVWSIGSYAFSRCSKLTSVTIGNSVKSIQDYAFSDCSNLTSITIPNSVTSIWQVAFSGCSNLSSVTIPNSVTFIGYKAFYGCSGLKKVELNSNAIVSNTYSSSSTIGTTFGSQVKEYIIGDSVKSIGNCAFYKCDSLTSVTIPSSVSSIGGSAFYGCSGLTSIEIPSSVSSIGGSAFYGCKGLTSITIPNSVTSIGGCAFYGCKGLTSITIPNSVTSIGEYAFEGTVWYNNQPDVDGLVYAGLVAYKYRAMSGIKPISIKEGTLGIAGGAFSNWGGLTSITIPNSVTSIGDRAFYECSGLKSVTIPNSVTSIGSSAFFRCSGLTSVTIGNNVTEIGDYIFWSCNNIKKMKVDKTTPISINSNFFNNAANAVLYIPKGSKTSYSSADNWIDFKTITEFPDGDVNWDGEIDVVDVVDIARFIVGAPRDAFDDFLADMNGNGSVNVADAVVLVNEIAGDIQFARGLLRAPQHDDDVLSLCYNNDVRLSMQLEGAKRYTAFQFDLWLPSDINLTALSLNNLRSQGHQLLYNKVEDGHYRIVVLSTSRKTFNGTSGELLSMMLDGFASNDIMIDNIHFVTSQGYDVPFDAVSARYAGTITDIQNVEPTSVEKRNIYNLNGQRLVYPRKSINIIGGKKIIVK